MNCTSNLLTTREAAQYIGFHPNTLRNSRYLGRLAGVEAPAYRKFGRVCRYKLADLDEWLNQFQTQTSTSENAFSAVAS